VLAKVLAKLLDGLWMHCRRMTLLVGLNQRRSKRFEGVSQACVLPCITTVGEELSTVSK